MDQQKKILELSPSDLALYEWNPQDFFEKYLSKKRLPETPEMHWGNFCHTYTEMSEDEAAQKQFPISKEYMDMLQEVLRERKKYTAEQPFVKHLMIDDWDVTLNYRVDGINYDTGEVIELKFPTKPWQKQYIWSNVNSIKNLVYAMFHSEVNVWCCTLAGIDKYTVKKDDKKVENKIKEVIGMLQNNLFTP